MRGAVGDELYSARQEVSAVENCVEKLDGVYLIKGARVALDSVIYQFRQGRSPEAIQDAFPSLSLRQVYGAIAFYLDRQDELDAYLAQSEAAEENFSREIARLFPQGAGCRQTPSRTHRFSASPGNGSA